MFKEGQKVKIITGCSGTITGEICELYYGSRSGVDNHRLWAWGKEGECYCEDNWELVEEPKSPKFKIGDKVRVFGNTCANSLTNEGTIVRECLDSRGKCWYVSSLDYSFFDQYVLEKDMELISECQSPSKKVGINYGKDEFIIHCPTQQDWIDVCKKIEAESDLRWLRWGSTMYSTAILDWRIARHPDFGTITLDKETAETLLKPKKNTMENIIEFAKNLTLSKNEKALRKAILKDSCGNYTSEAREIVMQKLLKDNEEYLVEIATAKNKEDKEK